MPRHATRTVASLLALHTVVAQGLARSDGGDSDLCLQAALAVATETGVPYDVLLAISVVETGRNDEPWPWTVNIGGEGHWPESKAEAVVLVDQALQTGLTNVDLGCFQLNLYWHAQAFQSVEDMLDPAKNAAYAAEFLATKYADTGDWSAAAAAYHSATPDYAEQYQTRFDEALAALDGGISAPTPDDTPNRFPLLISGVTGSNGSLVPATVGGSPLIWGN